MADPESQMREVGAVTSKNSVPAGRASSSAAESTMVKFALSGEAQSHFGASSCLVRSVQTRHMDCDALSHIATGIVTVWQLLLALAGLALDQEQTHFGRPSSLRELVCSTVVADDLGSEVGANIHCWLAVKSVLPGLVESIERPAALGYAAEVVLSIVGAKCSRQIHWPCASQAALQRHSHGYASCCQAVMSHCLCEGCPEEMEQVSVQVGPPLYCKGACFVAYPEDMEAKLDSRPVERAKPVEGEVMMQVAGQALVVVVSMLDRRRPQTCQAVTAILPSPALR